MPHWTSSIQTVPTTKIPEFGPTSQAKGFNINFEVRGTGIGMAPEQLAKLIQRFTLADETTTRQFGGTGLGLALGRAFALLLWGRGCDDISRGGPQDTGHHATGARELGQGRPHLRRGNLHARTHGGASKAGRNQARRELRPRVTIDVCGRCATTRLYCGTSAAEHVLNVYERRIFGEGLRTPAGAGRASGLRAGVRKPPKDERAGAVLRYGDLAEAARARRCHRQPANPGSLTVPARAGDRGGLPGSYTTPGDTIRAAIVEPWSNGQTEGQVTRLKLIQRRMYGRANVDLLRARMVQPG